MADAALAPATLPINKASAIIAMSVLDLCGCLMYFCITMWLIVVARKLAHDADVQTITIHDYSLRVQRLPQDVSAEDLQEFFSQYGEVSSTMRDLQRHLP
jgi:hypothetical protein